MAPEGSPVCTATFITHPHTAAQTKEEEKKENQQKENILVNVNNTTSRRENELMC